MGKDGCAIEGTCAGSQSRFDSYEGLLCVLDAATGTAGIRGICDGIPEADADGEYGAGDKGPNLVGDMDAVFYFVKRQSVEGIVGCGGPGHDTICMMDLYAKKYTGRSGHMKNKIIGECRGKAFQNGG